MQLPDPLADVVDELTSALASVDDVLEDVLGGESS